MSENETTAVAIDVWSDIACPWCYIGKRRLEKAIEKSGRAVEVRYRAFELNPRGPAPGVTREIDELALKFGSREQAEQMLRNVAQVAAEDGLDYHVDDIVAANTRLAHRLIAASSGYGVQSAVVEGLFRAHFTEGRDVGDTDVLVSIGQAAGMTDEQVREALSDPETDHRVRDDEIAAQSIGIQGVPFYVLDGRFALSGAQSTDRFVAALERVALSPAS